MRNNKGNIGKVVSIFKGHCTAKYHIEFQETVKVKRQYLSTKTIAKHFKNIIDLIEIGDYANGGYIFEIGNAINGDKWVHTLNGLILYNEDIKTIWTKEQLKAIEYNV